MLDKETLRKGCRFLFFICSLAWFQYTAKCEFSSKLRIYIKDWSPNRLRNCSRSKLNVRHITQTKGISFLFRIFSKKRNLERSLFVPTPFSYKLKFQRTPMPSDAIYRVWVACGAPLILIPKVFNRKLIKLAICYQDHQNTRK